MCFSWRFRYLHGPRPSERSVADLPRLLPRRFPVMFLHVPGHPSHSPEASTWSHVWPSGPPLPTKRSWGFPSSMVLPGPPRKAPSSCRLRSAEPPVSRPESPLRIPNHGTPQEASGTVSGGRTQAPGPLPVAALCPHLTGIFMFRVQCQFQKPRANPEVASQHPALLGRTPFPQPPFRDCRSRARQRATLQAAWQPEPADVLPLG